MQFKAFPGTLGILNSDRSKKERSCHPCPYHLKTIFKKVHVHLAFVYLFKFLFYLSKWYV